MRIADVCLMARSQPIEQVLTNPPLAVIEILSPEDRISRYNERLADYRRPGIPSVWVIDPANRVGYDCSTAAWLPVEEFRIIGSPYSCALTIFGSSYRRVANPQAFLCALASSFTSPGNTSPLFPEPPHRRTYCLLALPVRCKWREHG